MLVHTIPLQPGQIHTKMLFWKISTPRNQDWRLNKVINLVSMNCQTTFVGNRVDQSYLQCVCFQSRLLFLFISSSFLLFNFRGSSVTSTGLFLVKINYILPHIIDNLKTKYQTWNCIQFHESSLVTCNKEFPLTNEAYNKIIIRYLKRTAIH